jgi:hypothetical protein
MSGHASFEDARRRLQETNPSLRAAWWPVLPRSLTLSALAEAEEIDELERMLRDAEEPLTVLLDLELPIWDRSKMLRLLRQPSARRRAARALDRLFATALAFHSVWTAEYPPLLPAWLTQPLRLELRTLTVTRVYMLYSSLLPRWWRPLLVRRVAGRLTERGGAIGVGALATGIAGNEPILSPERLSRDLAEAAQLGAASIVAYRLGGLTPAHVSRIELWQRPVLSAVRDG